MIITCANMSYACSTCLIGNFSEGSNYSFKAFIKDLKARMNQPISSYTGNHKPSSYSFMMASTNSLCVKTKEYLTELGFHSTEPSKNRKNDSIVQLHFISIHNLIKKLKEYSDE